jgi:ABC-2 type transport system ATP-binding protein
MDEAERCHQIAYLAYGNLLTRGTVADVIASAKLSTWEITGPDLPALAARLRKEPGLEELVAFGNTLHISSRDSARAEQALAPLKTGPHRVRAITPGLEDVFISLMNTAQDNFKTPAA